MADLAVAVMSSALSKLTSAVLLAAVESVSLPGARTPARLSTWTNDTPELKLNLSLLVEAFLQLLASGLGTLAFIWATVVLLGGFSTMLPRADFWFTTAIVFVETARIVGYNSAPEAKFFVDALAAWAPLWFGSTADFVQKVALVVTWIALAPIFAAAGSISLSILRLIAIARHRGSSTDASNGNLAPALILFYALVLTQGALFLLWLLLAMLRLGFTVQLSRQYWGNEGQHSRKKINEGIALIERYANSIADTCIEKGVSGTVNSNLISFAEELLQPGHPNDIVSAVSVLHLLVVKNTDRSERAVEQICSSEKYVYRLVRLLRSKDLDPDVKALVAEIVAKLACKLLLADMPGVAQCISSLLDPQFMRRAAQTDRVGESNSQPLPVRHRPLVQFRTGNTTRTVVCMRPLGVPPRRSVRSLHLFCRTELSPDQEESLSQSTGDIDNRAEIKPLIVHGLVILGMLAEDPENCTEIYKTTDLVAKIIAPVSSGLHIAIRNDEATAEIVRESLHVVATLTRGTGESSIGLRRGLVENHGRTAENILWILSNSSDQEMRMRAVEILSRLTLDRSMMPEFERSKEIMLQFVRELQRLLFDPQPQDNPLTLRAAGKALNALLRSHGDELFPDGFPDVQTLVTIMGAQTYCKEHREVTAEILAQICAKSSTDEDRNRFSNSVANALSTALEVIVTEATNAITPDTAKFLAPFLGLAVQICESRLATAEAFADVLTASDNLGEKLKVIIEAATNNDNVDEVCLAIVKDATKLVSWIMMERPDYVQTFREATIVDKLDAAVKAMAHLDRYVVMTGGADEIQGYVTLQALVEEARNILVPPQQHTAIAAPPPEPTARPSAAPAVLDYCTTRCCGCTVIIGE